MIQLKKITLNQLVCLLVMNQVGAYVLSVAYVGSKHSGSDSWIVILLDGLFVQMMIFIIYLLAKRYPDQSLPQYIFLIVGKPLGSLFNLLFGLYFMFVSLMVVVSYSDILSRWVLIETPWFVLVGMILLISAYAATTPLRSIATTTQVIAGLFLVCVVIIFISGFGKGEWDYFLPIGRHGIQGIMEDAYQVLWAFAGYELLFHLFPYVKRKKESHILVAATLTNAITTSFYLMIILIVNYNFSEKKLATVSEPIVYILRKFSWAIVQSLDIVFMTIWLAVIVSTVYLNLYMSARHLSFLRKKEIPKYRLFVWIATIVSFTGGVLVDDRQILFKLTTIQNRNSAIFIVIVPILLFIISSIRKRVV
ncbi:GerAB/ArcD/ProY family transporter [Gottfriedia sp. NPDC057991]|uniref:GerAB/ArcD/ProY family transporter n=1 Tax=Gottfriedia sp. NPDC057991 TaxID=3346298 RepID=UPI0036DD5CB4